MSAYLYYKQDAPLLSDAENDRLCRILAENWKSVPPRYKPLLDPGMTQGMDLCMTSYHCLYTRQVEMAALWWYYNEKGRQLEIVHAGNPNFLMGEAVDKLIPLHEMMN